MYTENFPNHPRQSQGVQIANLPDETTIFLQFINGSVVQLTKTGDCFTQDNGQKVIITGSVNPNSTLFHPETIIPGHQLELTTPNPPETIQQIFKSEIPILETEEQVITIENYLKAALPKARKQNPEMEDKDLQRLIIEQDLQYLIKNRSELTPPISCFQVVSPQ